MKVLFDTHALAWWLMDSPRLSVEARRVVSDPGNTIFASPVSAFEMATKCRIGKWPTAAILVADFEGYMARQNFTLLPVTAAHALRGGSMVGEHRDPFDRLLAGQSLVEGLPLLTSDREFRAFGVEVVW